jgi:hypothetical protein
MRRRQNEPWHNEEHRFDQGSGRVLIRRFNPEKKRIETVDAV